MNTVVAPSGPWSAGTIATLIAVPLLVAALLGGAYALRRLAKKAPYGDSTTPNVGALGLLAATLLTVGLTVACMWPFDSEYHQWRPVDGRVTGVSSGLISHGKATSTRFVVVIDGQAFGVDDTRAALVKPGDVVHLACKRDWQYAGTSGWACRWGQQ